jgi:hypothetical protein
MNRFDRKLSRNIGTSPVTIGSYTVDTDTQVTLIGLSLANLLTTSVTVSVYLNDGVNDTYIIKDVVIPANDSLSLVGAEQKIVLITGDSIKVESSDDTSVDAVMSLLEIIED